MANPFQDKELRDLLTSIGDDVIESAQRELRLTRTIRGKKRNRYNTGTLSNSLAYRVSSTSKVVTYTFYATGAAKNYWQVIHNGRRKGATPPPIAPIKKWVEQRKLKPRSKSGGFIQVKNIESWRWYVAKKIKDKIGREGIEAVPFFKDAFESVWSKRKTELKDNIDQVVKRRLDKAFK